jgi:DNA-binding SARP family transcriptional activator
MARILCSMECAKKRAGTAFELRMLGPLAVSQHGSALDLPASRKARAFLAYLALTPCATPRTRLCELLTDTASDSRAELRWYLSKLRGVVGARRVRSNEDSVRMELADSFVDALEVQRAARKGFGTLAPERARALLGLFGGDFLEGLEIDGCPGFAGWRLAQQRRFRAWHVALLHRVVDSAPEAESLGLVEKWLELAPYDVLAHEHLLRALVRRGRIREGKEHLAVSLRLFSAEGLDGAHLERVWRAAMAEITALCPSRVGRIEHDYDLFLEGCVYAPAS